MDQDGGDKNGHDPITGHKSNMKLIVWVEDFNSIK